jgi:hypothetical protein
LHRYDEKLVDSNSNAIERLTLTHEQDLIRTFLSEDEDEVELEQWPKKSSSSNQYDHASKRFMSTAMIVSYKLESDLKLCSQCNRVHSRTPLHILHKRTSASLIVEQQSNEDQISESRVDRGDLEPASSIIERINAVSYKSELYIRHIMDSMANLNRIFESLEHALNNSDIIIKSHVDSIKCDLLANCAAKLTQADKYRTDMHLNLENYKKECSLRADIEKGSFKWKNLLKFLSKCAEKINSKEIDSFLKRLEGRENDQFEREYLRKKNAELDTLKQSLDIHKHLFYSLLFMHHKVTYTSDAIRLNKLEAAGLIDGIVMCFSEHASTLEPLFSQPLNNSSTKATAQSNKFFIANLLD